MIYRVIPHEEIRVAAGELIKEIKGYKESKRYFAQRTKKEVIK